MVQLSVSTHIISAKDKQRLSYLECIFSSVPRKLFVSFVILGVFIYCVLYIAHDDHKHLTFSVQSPHNCSYGECCRSEKNIPWTTIHRKYNQIQLVTSNQKELRLFQAQLVSLPNEKPKAILYTLLSEDTSKISKLQSFFHQLDSNFKHHVHYPMILFVDFDMNSTTQESIKNLTESKVYFQKVFLSPPEFLVNPIPLHSCSNASLDYRNRQRFHSKTLYEQPILDGVEYMMNVDVELGFSRPFDYDIFNFMKRNNYTFGSKGLSKEVCVCNLWATAKKYIDDQFLTPEFFENLPEGFVFSNHFEASATSIWKSAEYKDYIDFMDKQGGIYYHQWSDMAVKSIAISIFVSENKIKYFQEFH